ncbi:glucosamine-6-phosphate deaminase [Quadrisphaera granulorum]|uniref:Glucosamine-6-phosphate deaminase n=1 Tax=Quadrisphaera granulorum TaxID=317664 RepID=A0A315ZVQ2_9ACTN|nr:glucosamine-6-phosphate deaminase [Quadrisphaera granulorum]SZE98230.1 glucosamine-6-phosphate deaminase [Quadrisphaera granulorum]
MRVLVVPEEQAAHLAADAVTAALQRAVAERGRAVLGIATGGSPLRLYRALGERVRAGEVDASLLQGFLLDEYVGLPAGHAESYREVVRRDLQVHVPLADHAVLGPDPHTGDHAAAALAYEEAIAAAGGVDVQVLGIGGNGHLAFNEPGSPFDSRTRLVELAPRTREDNARYFGGDVSAVPVAALTQGLATIAAARELVLVASGAAKAQALAAALEGPVDVACPASLLQLHPRATVVLDPAAASLLA